MGLVVRRSHITAAILIAGALVAAAPSESSIRPLLTDRLPIDDDLSGWVTDRADPDTRKAEHPSVLTARAVRRIAEARLELSRLHPEMGARLLRALPRIEHDDAVGTLIASGDAIRFNRAYVVSLPPGQLFNHILELALAIPG